MSIRDRLSGVLRGGPDRTEGTGALLQVDSCWVLQDGSICIDGWVVGTGVAGTAIAARLHRHGGDATPWTPLLRKSRPDVLEHLYGVGEATSHPSDVGFVGRLPGAVTGSEPVVVEVRGMGFRTSYRVLSFRAGPVPEETFAGLAIADHLLTPELLQQVADVMSQSPRPPEPTAITAYELAGPEAAINIVVPVFGNFDYLSNLLLALAQYPTPVTLTVVCDDPILAPALVGWLREWNDSVYGVPLQALVHDRNAGFAAAINTGWRQSSSDYQLLLNSDIVISDAARDLPRLVDLLADGDVAAVAPALLFPDGRIQHAGMVLEASADFPGFTLPGHPGKGESAADLAHEPFDVPMLSAAVLLLRTADLRQVGGMPTVFGRGDFEDVILSRALRERGRLLLDPTTRWTHVEGASYRRAALGGVPVTLAKSIVIDERMRGGA